MDTVGKQGRLSFPIALLAFPFYLFSRSPGKQGSHFDPECDLFQPSEKNLVLTSNAFLVRVVLQMAQCSWHNAVYAMAVLWQAVVCSPVGSDGCLNGMTGKGRPVV